MIVGVVLTLCVSINASKTRAHTHTHTSDPCDGLRVPTLTGCDDINATDQATCENHYAQLVAEIGIFYQCHWHAGFQQCLNGKERECTEVVKWAPILQYDDMYTPTTSAVNEQALGSGSFAFAKLSDQDINSLGQEDADGWFYYKLESQIDTDIGKPQLFIRSKAVFVDTANAWGIMENSPAVCKEKNFESCHAENAWKGTWPGKWGLDLMRIAWNDCYRWLTDYSATGQTSLHIGCFTKSNTQRCAVGRNCGGTHGTWAFFEKFLMSKYVG